MDMENEITSIPKLRFPEFEGKLKIRKSNNLFVNSRSKGNDTLPIFSVTQDKGLVPRNSLEKKMKNDAKSKDNLSVEPEDLTYNMMRMWQGAVGIAYQKCMVSPAYIVLKPTKDVSSEFFIQFFNRRRSLYLFTSYSYGLTSDRLRLYFKDFASIKFATPTLPEQQKIASFLSAIDQKIGQLTRKRELLEQYKKGVMQKIFSREIRFKDKNGQDYPDWLEKRLGTLAKKVTTKNQNNTVTHVLTNSATQGVISQRDYFKKDIANQNNLEGYYIVDKDDFVYNPRISSSAPVGPIKRNKLGKGVMSPLYSVLRFDAGNLNYFEYYFETTGWHKYMHSIANFGARHDRMNITNADFLKMPIPYPCKEERNMICLFLENLTTKLDAVKAQLTQTRTFKKGLLQQLFV